MKNKLLEIINYFGTNSQQRKLAEEVFELQTEITLAMDDFIRFKGKNKQGVLEELADCMVVLRQFQHSFGITEEELKEKIEFKVERTLERIQEDYYESIRRN